MGEWEAFGWGRYGGRGEGGRGGEGRRGEYVAISVLAWVKPDAYAWSHMVESYIIIVDAARDRRTPEKYPRNVTHDSQGIARLA